MERTRSKRVNARFLKKMRKALGTLPDVGTQEEIEKKAYLRYVPASARRRLEMKQRGADDEALGLFKKLGVEAPKEDTREPATEDSAQNLLDLAAMPTQEFARIADEDTKIETLDDSSMRKNIGVTLAEQGPLKFLSAEAVAGAHYETQIPEEFLSIPTSWRDSSLPGIHKEYWLQNPFSKAVISWEEETKEAVYNVVEPDLDDDETEILNKIKEIVQEEIESDFYSLSEMGKAEDYFDEKVEEILDELRISTEKAQREKFSYYLKRDMLGLGKIEPFFHDASIEDISCDGIAIPVYVYHNRHGSLRTSVMYGNAKELDESILRIAQKCEMDISVAEPVLDGRLPDGSRVNATFGSEVTMHGGTFTIRRFREEPLTPVHMAEWNTCSPTVLALIWMALQHKYTGSLMVSGATASGKTSMLNAIAMFIPPESKVVTIEDTQELRLPIKHWLPAVSRAGFGPADSTGRRRGEVSMFDLLRAALRQRPDYMVVGEVRGEEAYVMFQGMATGHPALGTIHADSVTSLLHRLVTRPINLPPSLLSHLNTLMIQGVIVTGGRKLRRTLNVTEIVTIDPKTETPVTRQLFRWNPKTDTHEFVARESTLISKIAFIRGMDEKDVWDEITRRALFIDWMRQEKIFDFKRVGELIGEYYKSPEIALERVFKSRKGRRGEEAVPESV
jgi:flagellar protein FlaI